MSEETRGRSIDELAKGLASGSLSRRKALRLMGAALVAGALGAIPAEVAFAAARCPAGQTSCGKKCCDDATQVCIRGGDAPACITSSPLCGTCPRNTFCCEVAGFTGCCHRGCSAFPGKPGTFTCTG